jgi:hypothetical protein
MRASDDKFIDPFLILIVRSSSAVVCLGQTKLQRASPDCDVSDELSDTVDATLDCSLRARQLICSRRSRSVDGAPAFQRPISSKGYFEFLRAGSRARRRTYFLNFYFSRSLPPPVCVTMFERCSDFIGIEGSAYSQSRSRPAHRHFV